MSAVRFSQLAPGARLCTWGLAFGLLSLFLVAPATAQLAVSSKPVYPQVVQVGDTDVPVEIVIRNDSSEQVGTIEISEIFHSPSCQNVSFPCSAPDVAVFDLSATATGGAACTGITFTVVAAEPPLEQVQFVPDGMILLAPMEECVISFTLDVLAAPGSDADPMSPGVQTFQTSSARGDDTDSALAGFGTGSDLTTVVEAAIEVTKECEDGFGVDGMITFSGTVTNTGGVELTGVTVVDDSGTPGDTADDQTVFGPATLAPGESQPFSGSYTPPASPSTDVVTATGDFTVGDVTDTVTDTAEATCELIDCAVEVDKQISCDGGLTFVDVLESDDPDGTAVESCVGWSAFDGNEAEPVTVRYVARNAGSVALSCTLTDTNDLVLAEAQNFELAVDETFELVDDDQVCSADLAAPEPNTAQVQCVCAGFENEEPVQAQDTASFECQEPGLAVTKLCEPQVDDVNAVTIDVTNPDNADGAVLNNCVVTDALAPACDTVVGPLMPGDIETITCDLLGLTEDTLNEVSVTCDIVGAGGKTITRTADDLCEVGAGCFTRSPGFFSTHPDLAALFLPVTVCGLEIGDTGALAEDLCFNGREAKEAGTSPQQLQLVRQCAAAALNLAATDFFGGNCESELPGIEAAFESCCQTLCTSEATGQEISASGCIERLDFFNNLSGSELDETELCPNEELGTLAPCSADPSACKAARGNGVLNDRDLGPGNDGGNGNGGNGNLDGDGPGKGKKNR